MLYFFDASFGGRFASQLKEILNAPKFLTNVCFKGTWLRYFSARWGTGPVRNS